MLVCCVSQTLQVYYGPYFNVADRGVEDIEGGSENFQTPESDITDDLASYDDGTTLLEIIHDPAVSAGCLNVDLNKNAMWADKWSVTMNSV